MLWILPLEPLEERYTAQMRCWMERAVKHYGIAHHFIEGQTDLATSPRADLFLNVTGTMAFKAAQLIEVARLFAQQAIAAGDVFFAADVWYPGLESIRYMADLQGIPVHIYGVQYAGAFDPDDVLHTLPGWAVYQEATWVALCDKVFVGSDYLRQCVIDGLHALVRYAASEKIVTTGLVWDASDVRAARGPRRARVIWPHRLAREKGLANFYALARDVHAVRPDIEWLITSSLAGQVYQPLEPFVQFEAVSKQGYYDRLAASSVMLSTAYQETFGYTIHEATALGVPVLCPRRACYLEIIETPANLYDTHAQARDRLLSHFGSAPLPVATLKDQGGFDHMLREMRLL